MLLFPPAGPLRLTLPRSVCVHVFDTERECLPPGAKNIFTHNLLQLLRMCARVHSLASRRWHQQVRGLVLAMTKLVITTVLFVLLVFLSENRSVATGMCSALLATAAACSARAVGDGAKSADEQSSSGCGSGGQQGDDEEGAELVERR